MSSKIERQTTDKLLMVSPDQFEYNVQTAGTNPFQKEINRSRAEIKELALSEFSQAVETLRDNGIEVFVLPSRKDVVTPDAVFPNNWVSFHDQGVMVIYPMCNQNRRDERQVANLQALLSGVDIVFPHTLDLSSDEQEGKILEGTGSMVLDRENRVAFAIESPRTTQDEFYKFCEETDFTPIFFHATDAEGSPIYHTNVIMSVGEDFAVICAEAIEDDEEMEYVLDNLENLGKEIIDVTREQVKSYCGNILQVKNTAGERKIIMSGKAHSGFTQEQLETLSYHGDIIVLDIPTIETIGGGSARCMLAEVFA